MLVHPSHQQAHTASSSGGTGSSGFQVRGGSYGGRHADVPQQAGFQGSSPQYFGGRTRTRTAGSRYPGHHEDVPQADAITLVSKERIENEELPGTINWVVYLMVATIGVFLTWIMSNVLNGIVVTLSLVPPLILTFAVYWWRHRAKLAPVLYWGTFWGGVVASIIFSFSVGLLTAWLISLLSMGGAGVGYKLGQAALSSIILFGVMEETVKYLVLKAVENRAKPSPEQAALHQKIIRERIQLQPLTERETMTAAESYPGPRQIRHPYGLVLLGMAAGMGFGILENILWVFAVGRDLGWVIPIFRSAVCIPFHAMLGGLIGEKLARNRWFGEDNGWLSCTWLPIVLHALFDFCLLFLGVLAIQRSYDRQDEIGFTSGALVGAFLVFLVTAAALWYKSKVLFEDSDSLPALEYRPMSLMPNELREDLDVEDPDAQSHGVAHHQQQRSGSSAVTDSNKSDKNDTKQAVIRAEEEERRRRLQEAEERAERGLPPKTGFVPTAVRPDDTPTGSGGGTNYPQLHGVTAPAATATGIHSNLNPQSQSWVPAGIQGQRQATEHQQQYDQLRMAEQARLRQLAESQHHSQ